LISYIGISAGDYSILYMSPEILLNFDSWGDTILNSSTYKDRVALIAIDEAHILASW
jgi:superfamily II DNA helicase RecQ